MNGRVRQIERELIGSHLAKDEQLWRDYPEERSVESERRIVAEWVGGLADWDCFFTLTFRGEAWSGQHAQRAVVRWCNRSLRGRSVLHAEEVHPGGHGAHVHGLAATQGAWRKGLWQSWYARYGRAKFEPLKTIGGVAGYVSKYLPALEVMKQFHRQIEWGVLNCNRKETLAGMRVCL